MAGEEKETVSKHISRQYPEHEKLAKVKNESQVIGAFLDWLRNEETVMS